MDSLREQILILVSTPIYAGIILFELFVSNYQHRKLYTLKDTLANVYLMLMNSGIDLAFRIVYLAILSSCWQYRITEITHPIVYWGVLLIAEDFIFYWLHRLEHMVRFFWAVHVTHHSSEKFNFTVGFRSSVLQPLYRFVFFMPLAFCGFKAADIVFMYSATQIWGILVHTEIIKKMGWFEHILVTPSHHRVHHASNPKYLDKNMGMFLILWDKLFGTFQPELPAEAYQPIKYGLTKNIDNPNAANLVLHEWKAIGNDLKQPYSWRLKLKYLFGPPGYSHDGSRLTSNEMRRRETTGNPATPVQEKENVQPEFTGAAMVAARR